MLVGALTNIALLVFGVCLCDDKKPNEFFGSRIFRLSCLQDIKAKFYFYPDPVFTRRELGLIFGLNVSGTLLRVSGTLLRVSGTLLRV